MKRTTLFSYFSSIQVTLLGYIPLEKPHLWISHALLLLLRRLATPTLHLVILTPYIMVLGIQHTLDNAFSASREPIGKYQKLFTSISYIE